VARHVIDKDSVSDNNQNTAEDFARYFEDEEMLDFLKMLDDFLKIPKMREDA
jgi:hypothetical protein